MSLTALSFAAPLLAVVDEDDVKPGLVGTLIVVGLAVSLFFLIRSMNKQIGKIQVPTDEEIELEELTRQQAESGSDPKP